MPLRYIPRSRFAPAPAKRAARSNRHTVRLADDQPLRGRYPAGRLEFESPGARTKTPSHHPRAEFAGSAHLTAGSDDVTRQMFRPSFVPPPEIRRLRDVTATASIWSTPAPRRKAGWRSSWKTPASSGRWWPRTSSRPSRRRGYPRRDWSGHDPVPHRRASGPGLVSHPGSRNPPGRRRARPTPGTAAVTWRASSARPPRRPAPTPSSINATGASPNAATKRKPWWPSAAPCSSSSGICYPA